jgi:hypothetical protein
MVRFPLLHFAESNPFRFDWYFFPETESFITKNSINSGGAKTTG